MLNEMKFSYIRLMSYNYSDDVYLYEVHFNKNKLVYYYVVVQNVFIFRYSYFANARKKFVKVSKNFDDVLLNKKVLASSSFLDEASINLDT